VGKPTSYEGTAFIQATVSAFAGKLNPQDWSKNAGEVWRASYLVARPSAIVSPVSIPSTLPPDRTTEPPLAPPIASVGPGTGPSWEDQMFFEDVIFGGFRYRNILWTSYTDQSGAASEPYIDFKYEQYECLNTKSVALDDGGVDVDNGGSHCEAAGIPGQVKLTISKTVRFTQPDYAIDEVNALAEVLVPLSLDIWLHSVMFNP
jgi:hypothetical protein